MSGFRKSLPLLAMIAFAVMLPGCADLSLPPARKVFSQGPDLPELPARDETIRGEDDPPVVTLKVGAALRERALGQSGALPEDVYIGTINLQDVPVSAALEAVLAGTDISLSYQSENFNDRLVTLVNLSGPLPKVVKRICSAAKIFCIARGGNLELKEKQSFIIELPPIERSRTTSSTGTGSASSATTTLGSADANNSIVAAVSQLAGSDAKEDAAGGNLIYTTDVEGQERVRDYLEQLRNGRPLVVMQMYIWEVSLDSDAAAGINWKNLTTSAFGSNFSKVSLNSESALSAVTGGVSMGAVLSGKISAQIVANFLSTQGVVQTLSNPQLTFVSGSSAEFRVGGTRSYVSSVGQLTTAANTVTGSTPSTTTGIGTNTVATDKLETGLRIEVNGSYESGVIFATLAVSITDLIKIDSIDTGSTTLQLPETTNRNFSTVLRVRPGDNIVLAGMTSSRDDMTRDRLNVPIANRLPLRGQEKYQNRELVVLLKPAIVFFSDNVEETATDAAGGKKDSAAAPVVPARREAPPAAKIVPAPVKSAPIVVVPQPETAPLPLVRNEKSLPAPSARIDKDMLQSGFSRAFATMNNSAQKSAPADGGRP